MVSFKDIHLQMNTTKMLNLEMYDTAFKDDLRFKDEFEKKIKI